MPHLFIILFKINLVLLLFAAAYYLVLRKLTFYTLNRTFLIFGILFSSVYPFIDLTEFFHKQEINQQVAIIVPKLNQSVNNLVPREFIALHWHILSYIFYIGLIFMAIRLLFQFISLYKVHQKSFPGTVSNYPVRFLNEDVGPFSFWQTVYLNPSLHNENELNTILEHEKIHVKQWHTLDIILAELSVVFYWFNPGVWLMKKAVKENLEFITDERILKKGIDKKTYQYSLLDVGNLVPSVAIVNNFNLSDLKKRIKMMNAKRSSRLTLSRYLFLLPVLLLTTLAFTVAKKDIKKHLMPIKQILVENNIIDREKPIIQNQDETKRKRANNAKKINLLDTTTETAVFKISKRDSIGDLLVDSKNNMAITEKKNVFFYVNQNIKADETAIDKDKPKMFHVIKINKNPTANEDHTFRDSIKIVAYKTEKSGTESKINFKGIMYSKLPDSLIANKNNVTYLINGKKATIEAFKNVIKADDIRNISVQNSPQDQQILITTKSN